MNMVRVLSLLTLLTFCLHSTFAQAFDIQVKLTDTVVSEIYLGYHYADKQYIVDTAQADGDSYVFSGEEELSPGVYLLVFPPKNLYLEILIDQGDQRLNIETALSDLSANIQVKTPGQNEAFYEYIAFLRKQRSEADKLNAQKKETQDSLLIASINKESEELDHQVKARQESLIENYSDKMLSIVIKSGLQVEIPEMPDVKGQALRKAQYQYYKKHYFDHLDLSDDRLIRTPFIDGKIDSYISKLTAQIPDSISASLDHVLGMMPEGSDLYKHYLIKYVNAYSASKIVGMDAVFVHLADNYYREGKATWTDEESLSKILKRSTTLKPLLLGKKAPDFEYVDKDGNAKSLYDTKSPYTVLIFWDPDCGVCKKAMPEAVKFSEANVDNGVAMVGICTKREKDVQDCWDDIENKRLHGWTVGYDPYGRYKPLYDVTSTPMIYILDEEMTIISKKIGAKQLTEVMDVLRADLDKPAATE